MNNTSTSGKGARPAVIGSFVSRRKTPPAATVPAMLDPRFAAETIPPQQIASNTEPTEIGGSDGPEPTRYGDWERNGRCTDF